MGEGVEEIAVGVLCQALQGHRAASRLPEKAFQLVPPVRRDLGVGVERKALHTGTAGPRERGRLALAAKARADAPDLLASSLATGEALLHRGGHGTGEFGCVIDQRIISRGHGGDDARFQSTSTIPRRRAASRYALTAATPEASFGS